MISQNIAERPLDITSILNSFKSLKYLTVSSFKSIKRDGGKILTRKRNKIIASQQEPAKRWKKYLLLKKESALTFNSRKNLLFSKNSIFAKLTMLKYICPTANWQLFLILTFWNFSKSKIYYRSWIYIKLLRKNII